MNHNPQLEIVCVCGGYGYPLGNASAARITMVGKTLQAAGFGFSLLHCGPSPMPINTQRAGVYEGIPFEYTTSVRRPANSLLRVLVYLWGAIQLTLKLARLWPVRRSRVVYLYVMDGPLSLYAGVLCRLLGLPVVQEMCEWFSGEPTCSRFTKWFYGKPIFQLATGFLVISRFIEERILERRPAVNPGLLIHRLPAIVDAQRFAAPRSLAAAGQSPVPTFVYCGTWLTDISFLIRAFALVRRAGFPCKLKLVGGSLEQYGQTILDTAVENGLSTDEIVLTGCVDERTLEESYASAAALLMPLWLDERSMARIPNKMPEYLAAGRPVVAGKIGDLTEILSDGVNAYLAEPGNEREFADRMIAVLEDPARATRIGAAGREACLAHLDYRASIEGLGEFFRACFDRPASRRCISRDTAAMPGLVRIVRNALCGTLASALILCGRVRSQRRRALGGQVVSAIYFHKPNRRLFKQCIDWLQRHGYVFISAGQVLDWLYRGTPPPAGAVWISFDDGCRELLTDVLPLVRERGIPVTLFIPTGIVEGEGFFPWVSGDPATRSRDSITLAELKELAACPQVTIGGHTVTHAITAGLPEERTWYEVGECKRSLEAWTGVNVDCFAYPAGQSDGREHEMLSALGYRLAATTDNEFIAAGDNPFHVPRFSVADEIAFPEAICNMTGVWRPAIDPVVRLFERWYATGQHEPAMRRSSAVSGEARFSQ